MRWSPLSILPNTSSNERQGKRVWQRKLFQIEASHRNTVPDTLILRETWKPQGSLSFSREKKQIGGTWTHQVPSPQDLWPSMFLVQAYRSVWDGRECEGPGWGTALHLLPCQSQEGGPSPSPPPTPISNTKTLYVPAQNCARTTLPTSTCRTSPLPRSPSLQSPHTSFSS